MEDTHELTELIRHMTSANLISRFESNLDSQSEKIDAMKESQETKIEALRDTVDKNYKILFWVVGVASGVISLAIIFGG